MDDNMSVTTWNDGSFDYLEGYSEFCKDLRENTPSTLIAIDSTTLSQMHDDLEAILENYLFELNDNKTHQLIEHNISAYFSTAWPDYPITHLSVDAISGHGVGVSLQVGGTSILGDIGEHYQVNEFNCDFSITPEDLSNFGTFLKEWTDTTAPIDPVEIESVEDILFSAIKKT